ncbi:MAG: glycerol-3-phosphate dehydrogenase/oxidase [Anaerolineales bacterium]
MPASSPIFTLRTRAAFLEQLRSQTFDVVVIGGGITGAGIARDATLRGFSIALLEKQDFAGGTSGNSARIIHGGLRYVQSLQFGVVHQACAERRILHALAPHLVSALPSTIPLADDWRRRLKVQVGFWAYDALAQYRNIHLSEHLTAGQLASAEPNISMRGGRDAIRYWERAADDARLTLAIIKSAYEHGALTLNYAEVMGLLKSQGHVAGVGVRDVLTGETFEVRAARVVNATGPWNDAIRNLDQASAPSVRPNKGIHVAVPHAKFPIAGQVIFAAAGDQRMLYAVPWRTTSLIGTTDADYAGDLESVYALRDEVTWLLESVNRAFADTHLTDTDVVSTFAGLRPLVHGAGGAAYGATREHHISISDSGLISIAGGKLTTHRAMAKDVMDVVSAQLGRGSTCRTDRVPLDSSIGNQPEVTVLIENARAAAELEDDVLRYLVSAYGSQCMTVLNRAAQDKSLGRRMVDGLPYLYAEIPYAVEHEMACTLNDVLIRRTRLLHEAPGQGLPLAHGIAVRMAPLLGWSADDMARQVNAYRQQVALTRRFDSTGNLPEAQHEQA